MLNLTHPTIFTSYLPNRRQHPKNTFISSTTVLLTWDIIKRKLLQIIGFRVLIPSLLHVTPWRVLDSAVMADFSERQVGEGPWVVGGRPEVRLGNRLQAAS